MGTLDSLYSAMAEQEEARAEALRPSQMNPRPLSWHGGGAEQTPTVEEPIEETDSGFELWSGLTEAFATIPPNLVDSLGAWVDPLGLGIGDVGDIETAAGEQEVATGTFGAMQACFDGAAGAFAYLLFILLYFPCVAALAAVYRETSMGWTLFVAGWTTGLAHMVASIFYQAVVFTRHPEFSMAWIAGMLALFVVVMFILRYWGRSQMALRAGQPEHA